MVNQVPDPDRLDGLLRSWTGTPVPTGGLDAPVWRRIEARSARLTWMERLTDVAHALDVRLARPQALAALVALALVLGLGLAEWRTESAAARVDAEMSARYMALVNPVVR